MQCTVNNTVMFIHTTMIIVIVWRRLVGIVLLASGVRCMHGKWAAGIEYTMHSVQHLVSGRKNVLRVGMDLSKRGT